MGIPSRPAVQHQGPACHCSINGKCLGWLSCTAYSKAMQVDRSTLGKKRPSGCDIRRLTGDTIGGLTLNQCETAARHYGVSSEVRVGSNVCSPDYAFGKLHRGNSIVLQGNTVVLVHTRFKDTDGYVNHAVELNEGRGWYRTSSGLWRPKEVLVYDPAADGRRAGIASAPDWWPRQLVLDFAGNLKPWGDQDERVLGYGKFYCAIGPDTEPHVHLRFARSQRTDPFPDRMIVRSPTAGRRVNVRSGPSTAYPVVDTMASGEAFPAYQRNYYGQTLSGSRHWFGDHNGRRWIHGSGLRT